MYNFGGFNGILSLFLDLLNRVSFVLSSFKERSICLKTAESFSYLKFTVWNSFLISLLEKNKFLSSISWRTKELSYK